MEERIITVVDIGSYRTAVCTAKVEGNNFSIAAYKEAPSEGISHGRVINPLRAATVVKSLIDEIERELRIKITKIVTGIPGYGINGENVSIRHDRPDPDEFISENELREINEKAYSEDGNDKVYCAIPQSFRVGEAMEIPYRDVIGMSSESIEGKYRIFTGNKAVFDGNEKTFKRLNLEIAGKYLYPVASATASLFGQEKQNGVALVEFGGNTTNLVIYYKNIIRHIYTLPFGGKNITEDIANECKITSALAESIKRDFGSAMPEKLSVNSEKSLQIKRQSQADIEIPVKYLAEIIQARCKEIFDAILYKIEESGYADQLSSGIVLTGGSANLLCVSDYLKSISGYTVRRAMPAGKFSYIGFPKLADYSSASLAGLFTLAWEDCLGQEDATFIPEDTCGRRQEDDAEPDDDRIAGPDSPAKREEDLPESGPAHEAVAEEDYVDDEDDEASDKDEGGTWISKIIRRKKKEEKKEEKKKDNWFDTLFDDNDNV